MYTLQKAKEEIDAVAKHATDIAVHTLAIADNIDAKLETFKQEIAQLVDKKFAELSASILGNLEHSETSAVSDLGAKVAQLIHGSAPLSVQSVNDYAPHPQVNEPQNWNQGFQGGDNFNHH